MKKKQNFNSSLILLVISFLFFGCANSKNFKTLSSFYAPEDLLIQNGQSKRLQNYFLGDFYSYEIKRNVFAYPIAFLISENGDKSAILACQGITNECNVSIQIYQLLKKYEMKTKNKFYILALDKKIVSPNIKMNNKTHFSKTKQFLEKNNDIFFDHILIPSDNCSGEDC
jgi:hypothetical protein